MLRVILAGGARGAKRHATDNQRLAANAVVASFPHKALYDTVRTVFVTKPSILPYELGTTARFHLFVARHQENMRLTHRLARTKDRSFLIAWNKWRCGTKKGNCSMDDRDDDDCDDEESVDLTTSKMRAQHGTVSWHDLQHRRASSA